MANKIQLSPAWCDEHLSNCWHSHNENTGENKHLGNLDDFLPNHSAILGAEMERLKKQGYQPARRADGYIMTQYNDRLTTLPLDWQMAIEERESVDTSQDW